MDRMGALMGGGVGLPIGFIFGSYSILRVAPHPPPLISAVSLTHLYQGVVLALAASLPLSHSTCLAARQHSHSFSLSVLCVLSPSVTHIPLHSTTVRLSSGSKTDTLPRLFATILFCHRIWKPRDSRCFL